MNQSIRSSVVKENPFVIGEITKNPFLKKKKRKTVDSGETNQTPKRGRGRPPTLVRD